MVNITLSSSSTRTKLLDENAAVNNINVNGLSLSKVSDASGEINDSFILRSTITKHIKSNNSIVVPSVSYDDNLKNKVALSENEISSLINTLISLFGSNRTINDLPVNELTVGKLYESVDELVGSYVLKATITDNLKDKEDDHTIVIPSASYDEYEILTDTEIDKLFASLDCLFKEQRISAISSFSGIAINKINDNSDLFADSYVIRSTISKELLNANDVVIPQNSIDSSVVDYQLLTKAELKEFFAAIATMGISDISNINANEIKVDKDKTNTLVASDIMRATITKNVNINNKAIYALTSSVDKTVDVDGNDILVLNEAEVSAMIGSLNVLSASGSISVNFDINLLKALSLEDLSNLLNSNSVRIAVSELLDVILSPTSIEEVYKLPNSTIKEDKSTFTKQEIINIISLLI